MLALCSRVVTWALVAVGLALSAVPVLGQEQPVAQPAVAVEAKTVKAPEGKPGEKPMADGKPSTEQAPAADAKKAEKDKAKEKEKPPEPVRRPLEPKSPADPLEFKVRPNAEGLVSFSFKGQTWPDVLEWLAGINGLNLHWEEVPPGYLDLTTRGRYTPAEARDMINSVLLAKGYTMLVNGEILVVTNLKTLDVSLVPRITPQQLQERGTYELAWMLFDLDWLMADAVAEEIKPVLSPHGKVVASKTLNRLDVMDTVGNLRRIRDVLAEEQSTNTQGRLVRQFKLKHTTAAEMLETLNTLLGIKPKPNNEAMTPQQMQMAQQQAMMMAQQQQAGGQKPAAAAAKSEPQVFLAINVRENTILANAPPDKMAVIEQAVLAVDVPAERADALLGNVARLRVYRLTGMAPETLVKVLRDIGGLDPTSRLEVDAKNKAVIAYATLVDHLMIQSLVERLDGTGRKFEVIQLRTLKAENVAGSIELLMRGPADNTSSTRSRYYYDPYGYGGGSQQADKADRFQVDADIEHNRLLMRATEAELAEVRELLAKLGELPDNVAGPRVRMVPAAPGAETQQLLERLKRIWPSVGPNALDVEEEPRTSTPPASSREASEASGGREPPGASPIEPPSTRGLTPPARQAAASRLLRTSLALADAETDDAPSAERPPIRITIGPNGLILSSPDTRALDQLEQLLEDLAPAKLSFRIFRLQHTYAKDVASLLKDVFKDEEDGKKSKSSELFETMYFGYSPSSSTSKTKSSLSKRRPMSFVPDPVTNTILVQNADEAQLAEIEHLITLYDRVEPPDSNSVRRTQMVPLKYAVAKQAAEMVKDVYRDLLSPNDKALQQANAQKQQQQERPMSFYSYLLGSDQTGEEKNMLPRFKGMLSVGVDELTNTLVLSAPQGLLSDVVSLVQELDRSAQPTRPVVNVLRLQNSGTAAYLKGATNNNARRLEPSRETNGNGSTPPMQLKRASPQGEPE